MKNNIKLSVVIPVYNQEELIIRALESVPQREDVEIIVIDDGSTDNTKDKVLEFKQKCLIPMTFFSYCDNKGVGYAVNRGLDLANGNYIVLLGSDDYLLTDEVSKTIDEHFDGTDLIYFDLETNSDFVFKVRDESKYIYCGSVKFMRNEFVGDTRCPEVRAREDAVFYKELMDKNPTEKFLCKVMKHYNFPREGSLSNLSSKGLI